MKIQITNANLSKLQDILDKTNGKASTHTLNNASLIIKMVEKAELKFDELGLPQTYRKDAKIEFLSGGVVAKSYKNNRIGTLLNLVRGTKYWFLVSAEKGSISTYGGHLNYILNAVQDAKVVSVLRKSYSVKTNENTLLQAA